MPRRPAAGPARGRLGADEDAGPDHDHRRRLAAAIAAFVPLAEIAKLVNIGTLFAFFLVNIGVIVLRRTRPDLERTYRVPFVPVVPLIGAGLCIFLMTYLDSTTWVRFGVWMLLGLLVYAAYGYRHSNLRDAG